MNTDAEPAPTASLEAGSYDFQGAQFDLNSEQDRKIIQFVLSQALYGEATAVYCGKSLFTARSLEAAQFYSRQARQELGHLKIFADICRALEIEPQPAHWVLKLLSSHNNYYPLKVLLEHAIGEGMVLDIFKDVLLQTLPDSHPRVPEVKKKLRAVCREEAEHVAWGERETKRILQEKPYLKPAFLGLVELQLALAPQLVARFHKSHPNHPVLSQMPAFVAHVLERVRAQGKELGYYPDSAPSKVRRVSSIGFGLGLYLRSKVARARSTLEENYLEELGFRSPVS